MFKQAWSIPLPNVTEQLAGMDPSSSLVDNILSSNTMKNLARLGDLSDSVGMGDLHEIIGNGSGVPSTIGIMDNIENIVKKIDGSNIPDASHYAKIIEMSKNLQEAAGNKINDMADSAKSIGSYLKNLIPERGNSGADSEAFIKQMMENSSMDGATKKMQSIANGVMKNMGKGDITSFTTPEVYGPAGRSQAFINYAKEVSNFQNAVNTGNEQAMKVMNGVLGNMGKGTIKPDVQSGSSFAGKLLKGLFGVGVAGAGAAGAVKGNEAYQAALKHRQDMDMELKNLAKKVVDLQSSNKVLQESNKALQTSNSSLTSNLPARLKNVGSSIVSAIKQNPGTSATLGIGAAGLAALPFLMGGSSDKPVVSSSKNVKNKKRKMTKKSSYQLDIIKKLLSVM